MLMERHAPGWYGVCTKAVTQGTYEGSSYYIVSPYADYLEYN